MRRWLFNCDDFGMHPSINRATLELLEGGIVRACSVMPVGQFYSSAVEEFKARGGKSVGVHLALEGEYSQLPVRPVLPAGEVPTLVDERGYLRAQLGAYSIPEAKKELRSQVERVLDSGLQISHLDGHMFFFDRGEKGEDLGGFVSDLGRVLNVPVRWRDDVTFIWEGYDDLHARKSFYDDLVKKDHKSLQMILIHPGDNLEELATFTGAGARRWIDYQYFRQPELKILLEDADIIPVGWSDL